MPRPRVGSGRVTEWREDLNSLRRRDTDAFDAEIERVKSIYTEHGSIKKTAAALHVGKRTFERAMAEVPELRQSINEIRARLGR